MSTIRRLFSDNDAILIEIVLGHFKMYERCVDNIHSDKLLNLREKILCIEFVTFYMAKYNKTCFSPSFLTSCLKKGTLGYQCVNEKISTINLKKDKLYLESIHSEQLVASKTELERLRYSCLVIQRGATFLECQDFAIPGNISVVFEMLNSEIGSIEWSGNSSIVNEKNVFLKMKYFKDKVEIQYF